ncbi:GlxA family transcriptional regulator [Neptunomonas japonica]|uniref:GlxA family transcriptional regulator n=1 Tax=Neptunomonas japonica TaxID=417574 RepID=UPI0004136824|nr:GlxA family transcriptional regulator [Neptunomonas japonica]
MIITQQKHLLISPTTDSKHVALPTRERMHNPLSVGFILADNFSMLAFTAAADTLVTANLVNVNELYSHQTISADANNYSVISDLGIEVSAQLTLEQIPMEGKGALDILIICGGFRSPLHENTRLSAFLKVANKKGITLGGIWNGAVHLAHAGLLNNCDCAVHPDSHAFIQEHFSQVTLSTSALIIEDKRISCATPSSALQMMLKLIEKTQGSDLVLAIRDILSCDRIAEDGELVLAQPGDNPAFPNALRSVLELMRSNLEEPIHLDELASFVSMSRRQIERMFQTYLDTTPYRYYLELRLTYAKRLLEQSSYSIIAVSVACGFLSTSHFSHCFKKYYGFSPSIARQQTNQ